MRSIIFELNFQHFSDPCWRSFVSAKIETGLYLILNVARCYVRIFIKGCTIILQANATKHRDGSNRQLVCYSYSCRGCEYTLTEEEEK